MFSSSEDDGLQLFGQLVPVPDAAGVEVDQFLKGSILRAALTAFEVDDGVVVNTRHLHRRLLRKASPLA
jgi:hypothetical protein